MVDIDSEAKHVLKDREQGGSGAVRCWVDRPMSPRWGQDRFDNWEHRLSDWSLGTDHRDAQMDTDLVKLCIGLQYLNPRRLYWDGIDLRWSEACWSSNGKRRSITDFECWPVQLCRRDLVYQDHCREYSFLVKQKNCFDPIYNWVERPVHWVWIVPCAVQWHTFGDGPLQRIENQLQLNGTHVRCRLRRVHQLVQVRGRTSHWRTRAVRGRLVHIHRRSWRRVHFGRSSHRETLGRHSLIPGQVSTWSFRCKIRARRPGSLWICRLRNTDHYNSRPMWEGYCQQRW